MPLTEVFHMNQAVTLSQCPVKLDGGVTLDSLCLLLLLSAPVPKDKLILHPKDIPPRIPHLSQPLSTAWHVSGTHHMPL